MPSGLRRLVEMAAHPMPPRALAAAMLDVLTSWLGLSSAYVFAAAEADLQLLAIHGVAADTGARLTRIPLSSGLLASRAAVTRRLVCVDVGALSSLEAEAWRTRDLGAEGHAWALPALVNHLPAKNSGRCKAVDRPG